MRGRLSLNGLLVGIAALAALLLTVTRPSPSGLIGFGDREVRAAPGEPAASIRSKHNLTALKVFNRTLVRVRDSYVDPARIDPKKMLYAALDSVQFNIPEVLIESEAPTDEVVVVVNDKQKRFSTKDVDSPWRLSSKLKEVFRFIEANMNPGADLAQVEYAAVNGMLGTLDPHSVLLDPEMAREMDVNTSGKFGGLGIVIGMRKRKLTVIRPMKATPASEAGIKAKDTIVKIDDEVTEHLTLNEAVDRMRGDPGTKVTLWIQREGDKKLMKFDLVRDTINVPSVEYKLLSGNVGYLKVKQFAGRTAKELKNAMTELRSQGATAWIVDLRWNPGGLLEQAIQVSDLFLEKGTIVTTVGGREREPRRAKRKGSDIKAPVAVLVNGSSASASEIVAGALKNLERAITIGTTSFGKGSVQILYDNVDGSKLKLTIAQYLTPRDVSIQSVGIVPDIELERMYVPKKNDAPTDFLRLQPPRHRYGEKDLKAHLDSTYAKQAMKPDYTLGYLYAPPANPDADADDAAGRPLEAEEDEEPPDTDEVVIDYEIEFARELVATVGAPTRSQMVKNAKKLVSRRRTEELKKLSDALGTLGVDWRTAGETKNKPKLDASFSIEGHTGEIKAGETIKLTGKVTNTGTAAVHRVHARVQCDDRVFDDAQLVFGTIEPGKSKTWTTHIQVPDDVLDRLAVLNFDLSANGTAVGAVARPLKYRVVAAERPVFAYQHQLVDASNGDGLVQTDEVHRLRITIKNIGDGVSKETTAILRNASGTDLMMKKARFELGELKPGEHKNVEFEFTTGSNIKAEEVVVELSVYDSVLRESVSEKLKYPVHKSSAGPTEAAGMVRASERIAVYEGASGDSATIAYAAKGTVFKVTGRLGEWWRVEQADGRPGFVSTARVRKVNGRPKLASVSPSWQVTPPGLEVQVKSFEVSGNKYTLKGMARDDSRVEDVYIFVSNEGAEMENRKVFYKSNRGGKKANELAFSAEIPIEPGSNLVTIIARENDQVKSAHTLYLYRQGGKTLASATP